MHLIVKRQWEVLDGSEPRTAPNRLTKIPPGRYEIERIPNPYGHEAPWLVLKGTKIGGTEGSWRQWENKPGKEDTKPSDWGEFEVVIED
ncbi:MAG: hypothetical protein Q7R93_05110 [bacterium]|nr:hypothetical protein [bacterium]